MSTLELFKKAFPEISDLSIEKIDQIVCTCKHGLKAHNVETDKYGSFVSDCNAYCDCTLFISNKELIEPSSKHRTSLLSLVSLRSGA